MIKKIFLTLFLVIGVIVIYLQHLITFDSRTVEILGKTYNLENNFPTFYVKYFFFKNEDPLYVWKDESFTNYQEKCHQDQKNCLIIPHQSFNADLIWLNSIQYVGTVLDSSKTLYLYAALENMTNLTPYWDYPYVFGELLIPISKNNESQTIASTPEQRKTSREQSIKIGEKGIKYNCDLDKIEQIKKLSNKDFFAAIEGKLVNDSDHQVSVPQNETYQKLKNPCKVGDMPGYLAFNYFYYLGDWQKASDYYKVASFQDDTAPVMANMVALVSGRSGQHIKSMQIWFNRFLTLVEKANSVKTDDERKIYESKFTESIKKAVFEYQLDMLQQLDANSNKVCYHDYDCMIAKGMVKESIFKDIQTCQKYNINLDLKTIANQITDNDEAYTQKVKCLMLGYGIQNKYISPDKGTFDYPMNDKQKDDEKFTFSYDNEINDWWISIKGSPIKK